MREERRGESCELNPRGDEGVSRPGCARVLVVPDDQGWGGQDLLASTCENVSRRATNPAPTRLGRGRPDTFASPTPVRPGQEPPRPRPPSSPARPAACTTAHQGLRFVATASQADSSAVAARGPAARGPARRNDHNNRNRRRRRPSPAERTAYTPAAAAVARPGPRAPRRTEATGPRAGVGDGCPGATNR